MSARFVAVVSMVLAVASFITVQTSARHSARAHDAAIAGLAACAVGLVALWRMRPRRSR